MQSEIRTAAVGGSRIHILTALRDRLAGLLDDEVDDRSAAGISKELRAVIAELDSLAPAVAEESPVASITARRAARVARAADMAEAGRRSQPRRSSRGG